MQSEIAGLAFVTFFVLLIVSIVFASKNKKLMKQAKQNTKKEDLVAKYYPVHDLALRFGFIAPIIFGSELALQTYGKTGGLVVLGLALLAIPFVYMASLFLQKKAKLKEAEGDESFNVNVKLIKKHYPQEYSAYLLFAVVASGQLGIYLYDFGIYQAITFVSLILLLFVPIDYLVHLKFLKKSKLKEQALTK